MWTNEKAQIERNSEKAAVSRGVHSPRCEASYLEGGEGLVVPRRYASWRFASCFASSRQGRSVVPRRPTAEESEIQARTRSPRKEPYYKPTFPLNKGANTKQRNASGRKIILQASFLVNSSISTATRNNIFTKKRKEKRNNRVESTLSEPSFSPSWLLLLQSSSDFAHRASSRDQRRLRGLCMVEAFAPLPPFPATLLFLLELPLTWLTRSAL